MFIAMNRFRIALGREAEFEEIWRSRDSRLDEMAGFQKFNLLRGPSDEECTLYASHTIWDDRQSFENWTKSENFRAAHAGGRTASGVYLGHPKFEGFEPVL